MEHVLAFLYLLDLLFFRYALLRTNKHIILFEIFHTDAANIVFFLLTLIQISLKNNLLSFIHKKKLEIFITQLFVDLLLLIVKSVNILLFDLNMIVQLINHLLIALSLRLAHVLWSHSQFEILVIITVSLLLLTERILTGYFVK